MLGVEAAQKNLVGLGTARVLGDVQARNQPHEIAGRLAGEGLEVLVPHGLIRGGRHGALTHDQDGLWVVGVFFPSGFFLVFGSGLVGPSLQKDSAEDEEVRRYDDLCS